MAGHIPEAVAAVRRGDRALLGAGLLAGTALGVSVVAIRALKPGEGLPGWFLGVVVLVPAALSVAAVLAGHRILVSEAKAELE
jgi:hypothetical protein